MAHAASGVRIIVPILILIIQVHGYATELQKLQRQKREWIIPPRGLLENKDYTKEEYIAKIRSDEETRTTIHYSLEGKGATEEPINLFTVNPVNGYVRINGILDREEIPFFHLKGVAMFANRTRAEKDIDLTIRVDDENDCPPVFASEVALVTGEVYEASARGTSVMKITATDADMPNTPHSQIAYTIIEQSPAGGGNMFYVNKETGEIHVGHNSLDREAHDTYTLTIKGTDMNGESGGLSSTVNLVVNILDVNDNIPILEKSYYEAKIMENTVNVTVLKIKALDADLIHTDNWLAVFHIVSGNEAGYFSITTDKKTNEGILVLNKAINYEELKELNLQVAVSNKANSTIITETKTCSIKIHVQNEPEGPRFQPAVKVVNVSEDHTTINLKEVITTYKAIDSDTLQYATNVIYAKGEDKDNWITIDRDTAEIRLNKLPDRESKYLVNGTYYAKIICISKDASEKTATGTIAIQVDHCPTLTSTSQIVCFQDNVVYATAVDGDGFPNGAPFKFQVESSTKEQWTVEPLNDTTVILRPKETLWPGLYKVFLVIKDKQGKACADTQVLDLEVCTCSKEKTCLLRSTTTAALGPAGILLLLLGLLLLFLLPLLLLFCLCGGAAAMAGDFKAMPWGTKEHLINYHTEGQGEDKEVPLLDIPTEVDGGFLKTRDEDKIGTGVGIIDGSQHYKGNNNEFEYHHWSSQMDSGHGGWYGQFGKGQYNHMQGGASGRMDAFEGIALSEAFLHNYYSQKASCFENHQSPKEAILVYDYEGQGSPVGSVGCCSLLQDDQDLDFLNDLGPKFKTLADICGGAAVEVESAKVTVKVPPPSVPHVTDVDVSREISQSIHHAKAEASSLTSSTTLIQDSIASATRPATSTVHLQENIIVPTQTLLVQQPALYYAATPPVYMVDPQPHSTLLVGPAVSMGENLVMVEKKASTGGSAQLHGISQGMQGAHGLVLLESRASAGSEPIIGTLGRREVVMLEAQKGMGSSSVRQINHGETLTSGNVSLSDMTVSSGSGGLIQVVPSQSLEMRGQSASGNVPLGTVHEGAHRVVVQERVSVTERNIHSSSTA